MARADTAFQFQRTSIRLALSAILIVPTATSAQVAPVPGSIGVPGAPGGLTTPIGTGPSVDARNGISYGVRASMLISSNLDLAPDGQKSGRHIMSEVAPYIQARFDSPRGYGLASYSLRGQLSESNLEFRHDLRAVGDIRITDEMFRVFASANIFQVNTDPFRASSYDPGSQRTNVQQYKQFEIAPYAGGRFDREGYWNVRYSLRYIDPGNSSALQALGANSPSIWNSVSAGLRTDLTNRLLGLSVSGSTYQADYEQGVSYTGNEADALAWLAINNWRLKVGAGVGYSQNSRLKNDSGENSGIGPSMAFEWAPDNSNFLKGRWAQRYYGGAGDLTASHRAANWSFSLNYSKGITDGNLSNIGGLYPGALGAGGLSSSSLGSLFTPIGAGNSAIATNPIAQGLANRNLLFGGSGLSNLGSLSSLQGSTLGLINGLNTATIVFYDALSANVSFLGARSGATAQVFVNNRKTAVPYVTGVYDDLDQKGFSLAGTFRMDPVQSLNALLRYTVSDSNSRNQHANLTSLVGTYDWRVTPRATVSFGARAQTQSGSGTSVDYNEFAVFVSADYRFQPYLD